MIKVKNNSIGNFRKLTLPLLLIDYNKETSDFHRNVENIIAGKTIS